MQAKIEFDNETLHGRLMKVFENCSNRIKTVEVYTKDKHDESASCIKQIEQKFQGVATIEMISRVYDAQKNLKDNFVNEFASFQ